MSDAKPAARATPSGAGPTPPPRSPGAGLELLAGLCALVAAAAIAVPLVIARLPKHQRHELLIAPNADDGTQRAADPSGSGSTLIFVDSVPPGATVLVDGEEQGPTPVSAQLHCQAGATVQVELKLQGFKTFKRALACNPGTLSNVTARLTPR